MRIVIEPGAALPSEVVLTANGERIDNYRVISARNDGTTKVVTVEIHEECVHGKEDIKRLNDDVRARPAVESLDPRTRK